MPRVVAICVTLVTLITYIGCGSGADPFKGGYVEVIERTLDGSGISTLDVKTSNGNITVNGSRDMDKVIITVKKKIKATSGKDENEFAQKVKIHFEQKGNEFKVFKTDPLTPEFQTGADCAIRCPSKININLTNENGNININGIEGSVKADIVNGNIEASVEMLKTEGRFTAKDGSIYVDISNGIAPITAITDRGYIKVVLPEDFSGQLIAQAHNGRISCDFPCKENNESPPNRLIVPIGKGGNTAVNVINENGNINVKM